MRWARALVLSLLLVALAACGTGPGSSTGNGNGNGNQATDTPDATATADATQGDGNGNGNGSNDVDGLIADLTPPNSTEVSRTTAVGGAFVSWESSDSVDSLKGFYEDAIPSTGMEIFSTTNAAGSYAWVFATDENGSFGGSVTVAPDTSGGSGSTVIVTVSDGS